MVNPDQAGQDVRAQPATFATTHWSVVLAAGHPGTPQAAEALEQLCRAYWYPLYVYLRRWGLGAEDAEDLTQGFLVHLFQRDWLFGLDRSKGRFRSFLLVALKHFLADECDRATATKRGGGRQILSLDDERAEERYRREPADERSPDMLFERQWAQTVLDRVHAQLEHEFVEAGKAPLFDRLQAYLIHGAGDASYATVAAKLDLTEEAVKKAVQRLRRRYYQLFRDEITQTVGDPAEVEDEVRHLCAVMAT